MPGVCTCTPICRTSQTLAFHILLQSITIFTIIAVFDIAKRTVTLSLHVKQQASSFRTSINLQTDTVQ